MLSSAARSFVRSTTTTATSRSKYCAARHFTSSSVGLQHLLHPHESSDAAAAMIMAAELGGLRSNVTSSNKAPNNLVFYQPSAAPVFVGFASPPSRSTATAAAPTQEIFNMEFPLDNILIMTENNSNSAEQPVMVAVTAAEDDDNEQDSPTQQGVLEMKRNRNNRPAKRANKGKRPCNRNARRNKLIKLGRRKRS